jgi:hypothetical protein
MGGGWGNRREGGVVIPFEDVLGAALRRMGLAEPELMLELTREWAAIAGPTWATKAVPIYVRGGVLVVETVDRGGGAFLRYGVSELERRLSDRFGPEVITKVEIRSPRRPGGQIR